MKVFASGAQPYPGFIGERRVDRIEEFQPKTGEHCAGESAYLWQCPSSTEENENGRFVLPTTLGFYFVANRIFWPVLNQINVYFQ